MEKVAFWYQQQLHIIKYKLKLRVGFFLLSLFALFLYLPFIPLNSLAKLVTVICFKNHFIINQMEKKNQVVSNSLKPKSYPPTPTSADGKHSMSLH